MIATPNEYLDARRPEWLDAEMIGRVRYDPVTRLVSVTCPAIASALAVHVPADVRVTVVP